MDMYSDHSAYWKNSCEITKNKGEKQPSGRPGDGRYTNQTRERVDNYKSNT
jgi:hypothetical protein